MPKIEIHPVETAVETQLQNTFAPTYSKPNTDISDVSTKVSALSLSSIRAKRELEKNKTIAEKQHVELPTEPFSETDMLLIWTKFAENKGQKGQKIILSFSYDAYVKETIFEKL